MASSAAPPRCFPATLPASSAGSWEASVPPLATAEPDVTECAAPEPPDVASEDPEGVYADALESAAEDGVPVAVEAEVEAEAEAEAEREAEEEEAEAEGEPDGEGMA